MPLQTNGGISGGGRPRMLRKFSRQTRKRSARLRRVAASRHAMEICSPGRAADQTTPGQRVSARAAGGGLRARGPGKRRCGSSSGRPISGTGAQLRAHRMRLRKETRRRCWPRFSGALCPRVEPTSAARTRACFPAPPGPAICTNREGSSFWALFTSRPCP